MTTNLMRASPARQRTLALAAAATAAGIALTACGGSTGPKTPSENSTAVVSKITLHVGQTGWASIQAELKAAGQANFPYKVDFSVFQGGNLQLEAVASGALDVAGTSEIPPIFASLAKGGGNFKVIAVQKATTLLQEIVVPKGSKVHSVADLKGKKVAYVANTTAHYFLLKILQANGLSWQDITPVKLTTAGGIAALLGGSVDALASYGNPIIAAHRAGATTLASAEDVLSGNFEWEATPAAIANPAKHAAIADLLGRLQKAYSWARAHETQWAAITAANTHQPVSQALTTIQQGERQRPTTLAPTSQTAIDSEQDVADTFTSAGLIPNKIDVSGFWSTAFKTDLEKIATKS
jgi:sulfonate transport system substrate-binding protein